MIPAASSRLTTVAAAIVAVLAGCSAALLTPLPPVVRFLAGAAVAAAGYGILVRRSTEAEQATQLARAELQAVRTRREQAEADERARGDAAAAASRRLQDLESRALVADGVAHDVANALSVVLGRCDELAARSDLPAACKPAVTSLARAAERAAGLAAQWRAAGREEAGPRHARVLDDVVRGLEPVLARLAPVHVRRELHLGAADGAVEAEAGVLEQLVVNVVTGARDAMPDSGVLSVATSVETLVDASALALGLRDGRYVRLRVTTTGGTPDAGGAPMSLARQATERLGGALRAEHSGGRGIVTAHLPLCAMPASARAVAPAPPADARRTLLVVEDEPMVRSFVVEVLRRAGHDVLEAKDAEEGLQALEGEAGATIGALVTDVRLPGMSGPSFVRRLRASRPGFPVLYVTGFAGDAALVRGSGDEAPCLLKPFRASALIQAVAAILPTTSASRDGRG